MIMNINIPQLIKISFNKLCIVEILDHAHVISCLAEKLQFSDPEVNFLCRYVSVVSIPNQYADISISANECIVFNVLEYE